MGKTTKNNRLLGLMEQVQWQGIKNWTDLREELQNDAVPAFKDWLNKTMKFVEPEDVREAIYRWTILGESDPPGSAFYIKKDRAVSVLIGLSKYQQQEQK